MKWFARTPEEAEAYMQALRVGIQKLDLELDDINKRIGLLQKKRVDVVQKLNRHKTALQAAQKTRVQG